LKSDLHRSKRSHVGEHCLSPQAAYLRDHKMSRLETVILEVAKMQHTNTEMQNCIHDCTHCAQTCLSMASMHCLEVGGAHVESRHFRLMLDCAEICQTAANFMLRGSSHHTHVCAECADILRRLCAKLRAGGRHGRLRAGVSSVRRVLPQNGRCNRVIATQRNAEYSQ
jgi:hypothetical protein